MPEIPKRPDDVSDDFDKGSIQLTTRLVESADPDGMPTLIIEGDASSLEYLGRLILSQAKYDLDCGYGIDPKGAGSAFFTEQAAVGIYIHRLPCMDTSLAESE